MKPRSTLNWTGERRLFLGCAADSLQSPLLALQQDCQQCLSSQGQAAVLVQPVNLHLTVRFLGQSSAAQAQALAQQLDRLSEQQLPAFAVLLDSLECWPGPKVLCLAGRATPALLQLDAAVDALALAVGFTPRQHLLRPHTTLARKVSELPALAATLAVSPLSYQSQTLILYHSDSTANGVLYRPLASWPLHDLSAYSGN